MAVISLAPALGCTGVHLRTNSMRRCSLRCSASGFEVSRQRTHCLVSQLHLFVFHAYCATTPTLATTAQSSSLHKYRAISACLRLATCCTTSKPCQALQCASYIRPNLIFFLTPLLACPPACLTNSCLCAWLQVSGQVHSGHGISPTGQVR